MPRKKKTIATDIESIITKHFVAAASNAATEVAQFIQQQAAANWGIPTGSDIVASHVETLIKEANAAPAKKAVRRKRRASTVEAAPAPVAAAAPTKTRKTKAKTKASKVKAVKAFKKAAVEAAAETPTVTKSKRRPRKAAPNKPTVSTNSNGKTNMSAYELLKAKVASQASA